MEIIRPSYEILTELNQKKALEILRNIERAGRVCYKSEDKNPNDLPEITRDFVSKRIKTGHEAVIEHEHLSVKFVCDRGVSHELVRHRLASFCQESTRYCNYSKKGMQFILPPWFDDTLLAVETADDIYEMWSEAVIGQEEKAWIDSMLVTSENYTYLLSLGQSPQQARTVLPNSLKTEIIVTTNLRHWREILRQRCAKAAHPQMRELMIPLLKELISKLPAIFEDMSHLVDKGSV